jgi:hypothetical protein
MSEPYEPWTGIPMPGLLTDPERATLRNRDPERSGDAGPVYDDSDDGEDASDDVAAYARQLWVALDEGARYLLEQLARGGGGPLLAEHRPLLSTEEQWQQWCTVYADVLSVLAGPHGDQGYGEQEARLEYQNGHLYREPE